VHLDLDKETAKTMQTPLILTPANALPHTPPATKQGTDTKPASQFHQVLSQQIKDRPKGAENQQQAHGRENAASSKSASNSNKAVAKSTGEKEKSDEATDDSDDKTESLPAAPTELMALVAQAAQFGQDAAKTARSETSPSEQTDAVIGASDAATKSTKKIDTIGTLNQLGTTVAQEDNSNIKSAVSQNAKQNNLLSATAQEASSELFAIGSKKQEVLSELPASANAPEVLSNLAAAPTHQNPLDALQSLGAGRPTEKLSPHVGTPAWDQALGQKIVWMVAGSQQSASLTLNPPDLGPLQVVLNVSNEQASATFISAQPEVRQAIEAALPKLREMMGEAGIQLGQTNINAGSGSQQDSSGEQNRPSPSSFAHGKSLVDTPTTTAVPSGTKTRQGLVNTFA
jgi:flagellar hook-length control protein FliK